MATAHDSRVIISDVDGVWTDGKIVYAGDRSEVKEFNVRDGLGAKLAQRAGITIVLLTSRSSPALLRRARELGIAELHQGAANKLTECESILTKLGVGFHEVLYAGDDLPDLAPAGVSPSQFTDSRTCSYCSFVTSGQCIDITIAMISSSAGTTEEPANWMCARAAWTRE